MQPTNTVSGPFNERDTCPAIVANKRWLKSRNGLSHFCSKETNAETKSDKCGIGAATRAPPPMAHIPSRSPHDPDLPCESTGDYTALCAMDRGCGRYSA